MYISPPMSPQGGELKRGGFRTKLIGTTITPRNGMTGVFMLSIYMRILDLRLRNADYGRQMSESGSASIPACEYGMIANYEGGREDRPMPQNYDSFFSGRHPLTTGKSRFFENCRSIFQTRLIVILYFRELNPKNAFFILLIAAM